MSVNTETVQFISKLNQLAEKSQQGFLPYSKATTREEKEKYLLYDDKRPKIVDEDYDLTSYPLISTNYVAEIKAFEKDRFEFLVLIEGSDPPYIVIKQKENADFYIVVEEGRWYYV